MRIRALHGLALATALVLGAPVAAQPQTLADIKAELDGSERAGREAPRRAGPHRPGARAAVVAGDRADQARPARGRAPPADRPGRRADRRRDRVVKDATNHVGDIEFRLTELEGGDVTTVQPAPRRRSAAASPARPSRARGRSSRRLGQRQRRQGTGTPPLAATEQSDFDAAVAAADAGDNAKAADLFGSVPADLSGRPALDRRAVPPRRGAGGAEDEGAERHGASSTPSAAPRRTRRHRGRSTARGQPREARPGRRGVPDADRGRQPLSGLGGRRRRGRGAADARLPVTLPPGLASALDAVVAAAPEGEIGVAVSGGGDSMALLLLLEEAAARAGRVVAAVTVDHCLRPESGGEAAAVAALCAGRGIAHATCRWGDWDGAGNLLDRARQARRALIADWARGRGIGAVALGHTLDDQAERWCCGWRADRASTGWPGWRRWCERRGSCGSGRCSGSGARRSGAGSRPRAWAGRRIRATSTCASNAFAPARRCRRSRRSASGLSGWRRRRGRWRGHGRRWSGAPRRWRPPA